MNWGAKFSSNLHKLNQVKCCSAPQRPLGGSGLQAKARNSEWNFPTLSPLSFCGAFGSLRKKPTHAKGFPRVTRG